MSNSYVLELEQKVVTLEKGIAILTECNKAQDARIKDLENVDLDRIALIDAHEREVLGFEKKIEELESRLSEMKDRDQVGNAKSCFDTQPKYSIGEQVELTIKVLNNTKNFHSNSVVRGNVVGCSCITTDRNPYYHYSIAIFDFIKVLEDEIRPVEGAKEV